MSKTKAKKLGTLKLTDAQREAIAKMVDSDGFKIWEKIIVPTREIEIGGLLSNAAMTQDDLWYYKGMSYQNSQSPKKIREIVDEYNKKQLEVDSDDEDVED